MADCTCEMPPEMAQAGRAAPTCHHSPLDLLEDTQDSLTMLSNYFSHQISIDDLFTKPMKQVADDYAISIVGNEEDYQLITENEYLILTAAFLRQTAILIQDLQVSLYIRIARDEEAQARITN